MRAYVNNERVRVCVNKTITNIMLFINTKCPTAYQFSNRSPYSQA